MRLLRPSDLTEEVVEMFAQEAAKRSEGPKHVSEFMPDVLAEIGKAATTRASEKGDVR